MDWIRLNRRVDKLSSCLIEVKKDVAEVKAEMRLVLLVLGALIAALIGNFIRLGGGL